MIRWLTVGREMGLTVPSMNPKHWVKGEPLAWIAAEKVKDPSIPSQNSRGGGKNEYVCLLRSSDKWGCIACNGEGIETMHRLSVRTVLKS